MVLKYLALSAWSISVVSWPHTSGFPKFYESNHLLNLLVFGAFTCYIDLFGKFCVAYRCFFISVCRIRLAALIWIHYISRRITVNLKISRWNNFIQATGWQLHMLRVHWRHAWNKYGSSKNEAKVLFTYDAARRKAVVIFAHSFVIWWVLIISRQIFWWFWIFMPIFPPPVGFPEVLITQFIC